MKLRIKENSIRLRLTMSEVAALAAGRPLHQRTAFGPLQELLYAIRGSQTSSLHATFDGTKIAIEVPQADLDRWVVSDEVAMSSSQTINQLPALHILIEKDFECLHQGHARDPDAFPHPQMTSVQPSISP